MTVSRCGLRFGDAPVGHGYVAGKDRRKAELVAALDALLQDESRQPGCWRPNLWPGNGLRPAGVPPPRSISLPWCVATNDVHRPASRIRGPRARLAVRVCAILAAMAEPGQIVALDGELPSPPSSLNAGAFAIALTLVDQDTPVWLSSAIRQADTAATLHFHCSCPLVKDPAAAAFAIAARSVIWGRSTFSRRARPSTRSSPRPSSSRSRVWSPGAKVA